MYEVIQEQNKYNKVQFIFALCSRGFWRVMLEDTDNCTVQPIPVQREKEINAGSI